MNEAKQDKLVKEIEDNISVIGTCRCGGPLIVYLGSRKKNMFDVRCFDCGSISDIRMPKAGDIYNCQNGEESPVGTLARIYKDLKSTDISYDIENVPLSKNANNYHGGL